MRGHSPASANCNAPAGSRTRGTSMGGLYVAYTTGALVHEIFLDLLVLFSFLKALRANPLMGLPLTSCILLFVSHCQVTSNPGSLFHLHLSIGCLV